MDKETSEKIEELYMEMYPQLYNYAMSKLENSGLADEAVQETFRIACTKPDDLFSSQNEKGWILNTLKYVIRTIRRTNNRLNRTVAKAMATLPKEDASAPMDPDIDVIFEDLVNDENFKLIKQIVIEKYTIAELSEKMGVSLEACRKRISRAKAELRKKIEKH